MKQILNYIQEKLVINKDSKCKDTFLFHSYNTSFTIFLPFKIDVKFEEKNNTVIINKIQKNKNTYNETVYEFYHNDDLLMKLSKIGVKNLFIRPANKICPKIYYLNGLEINKSCNITLHDNLKNIIEKH